MYKSPIEIKLDDIVSDAVEKVDEYIVACVQQVGVNVDKDELIKALKFDREQYEKGWNDRDAEIVRCKDCKHKPTGSGVNHDIEFPEQDYRCPCRCEDYWYSWMPDDDWFCANGERREDGKTD